jgi:hypothetical protein
MNTKGSALPNPTVAGVPTNARTRPAKPLLRGAGCNEIFSSPPHIAVISGRSAPPQNVLLLTAVSNGVTSSADASSRYNEASKSAPETSPRDEHCIYDFPTTKKNKKK